MRGMSRKFILGLVLFLSMVLIAACGGGGGEDEASSTESEGQTEEEKEESTEVESDLPQEVRVAVTTEALGLSPTETWDGASATVLIQLYETLVARDPESGEIVPFLAESFETVDDTTWIFNLREGINFHDGTPFNAEAVKYTFEKLVDPETAAPAAHILSFMKEIEVEDEYTIKLTTHEPSPNVLPMLASESAAIISPEADQSQNLMQEPVGTGPFKFVEWIQGDRIVLEKNEDYWGDVTAIESLTFITVPDSNTAVSMLEAKEIDLYDLAEPALVPRVEAMIDVDTILQPGSPAYYFSFNTQKEPMNEVEFRKAVAMAIDVDSFIDTLDGTGFKSPGMFGPAVLDYDEVSEGWGYDYDPDAARQIVEENGYGDYELTIFSTDQGGYKRQAEVAHANLTEIGLNVTMEQMEWGTLLERTTDGDHDMFVLGSSNSMTGLETMYGYFHTDSIGANNRTQHSNEEFDKLVDEARRTVDDEARQALINEAHEMLVEEVFMVNMYHSVNMLAHDKTLHDVTLLPTGRFLLKDAYRK